MMVEEEKRQDTICKWDPDDRQRSILVPSERSHCPGSDTSGAKDLPWLALVQSKPKRKLAPPPPSGHSASQHPGSVPSLKGKSSRLTTPPQPTNPFDEDEELAGEPAHSLAPPSVGTNHPWYSITQATEASRTDAPPHRAGPTPSKDPPWLALVQPDPKKKLAPPPPPGLGASHGTCSVSSLESKGSRPSRPQQSTNPFEGEDKVLADEPAHSLPPPSVLTSHPWYSITQATEASGSIPPLKGKGCRPVMPLQSTNPFDEDESKELAEKLGPTHPWYSLTQVSEASGTDTPPYGANPATSGSPGSGRKKGPAPGHGFPRIMRKVQSDQYVPVEVIHRELSELERQLDVLEQRLRDRGNDDGQKHLLVDPFTLLHEKQQLVRRKAELVYMAKQQSLDKRHTDVEYKVRCLLNKPEKQWTEKDRKREKELMAELVTIIDQRNQIIDSIDQDRQREEEEDKLLAAMLKRKDGDKRKKKGSRFKLPRCFRG